MADDIIKPLSFTLPKMGSTAKYAMGDRKRNCRL